MKDAALQKLNYILLCLLAAGFAMVLASVVRSGVILDVQDFAGVERPLGGWQLLSGDALQPSMALPQRYDTEGTVTLVARLDDLSVAQGMVNLLHCQATPGAVTVSIGDRVVYSCGDMGQGLMTTGALRDHYIPIESSDFGAPVYLTLLAPPGCGSVALRSALLTTRAGALMRASLQNFWRGWLGFAMLTVGLLLALAYFVMLRYASYPPMLWLGLFLACYSVWNNAYIHTLLALLADRRLYRLMLYALVGLGGVSWLLFAFYVGKNRHARLFNILITLVLLASAAALAACALRPSGQLYHFWLPDAVLLTAGAISLAVLLADYYRYQELCRPMAVGMAGAATGAVAGMLNAFFGQGDYAGLAVDLGLLFFAICFTAGLVASGIDTLVFESRMHTLELAAYRDQLTGCENRRAFDQKLEAYRQQDGAGAMAGLAMAMFDSNNLKIVNDTYGHARGDRLIIDTAATLLRYLGDFGTVYRIGGDEFVVVCDNTDRCALGVALEAFDREANANGEAGIDVSWGVAYYKPGIDRDPDSVLMRAEHRMYEYKKGCKLCGGMALN